MTGPRTHGGYLFDEVMRGHDMVRGLSDPTCIQGGN